MNKLSVDDMVFECMAYFSPWTFWGLQREIKNRWGRDFGETTISAAIRNLRKPKFRKKMGLPMDIQIVFTRRITNRKGYEYRLNPMIGRPSSIND